MENDIQAGKYKPDEQTQTELELCENYNVNRITIRKAIEELVNEGTLTRIPRRGTFVTSMKFHNELLSVSGFSEFNLYIFPGLCVRRIRSILRFTAQNKVS